MTGADDDESEEAEGSRFDKFLDRLDERAADRQRSETRTGSNEGTSDRSEDAPADGDTDTDPDPDGWLWGSPKGDSAGTSEGDDGPGGEETAGGGSEPGSERDDASATDGDRLWNTDVTPIEGDETGDGRSGPRPDSDGSVREGSSPAESEKTPEPTPDEADPTGAVEADDHPEPAGRDRWAELGSSLGADARSGSGRRSGTDDRGEPDDFTDIPEGESPQDDAGTLPRDDRRTADDTAGSDRTTPTLDRGRATEIDRVTSASSVLVLGPTGTSVSDAVCSRFLTGGADSRDVIFVTFQQSPEDRIDVCHRADDWAGGEIGIIEVGRGSRNAPAASEITGGGSVGSITVRHVSKPGDLSKLGIVITQLLSKFEDTPRRTVLCFHTLSALHTQVGTKTLFRFLNTLGGRLRSSDALGHYHMDPDLHDEIVIETLRPIFDSVVRYSPDGNFEIE